MEVGSCLQPAITVFEYASLIICTFDIRLHIIDVIAGVKWVGRFWVWLAIK